MQTKNDVPSPRTIEEYILQLPEKEQDALCNLWEIITETVPEVEEMISYQVPVFKYNGSLVGFGAAKKHLSFYVMSMGILDEFKEDLEGFTYSGGTIQFSPEKPLPRRLVEKIVRRRVEMNKTKKKTNWK